LQDVAASKLLILELGQFIEQVKRDPEKQKTTEAVTQGNHQFA